MGDFTDDGDSTEKMDSTETGNSTEGDSSQDVESILDGNDNSTAEGDSTENGNTTIQSTLLPTDNEIELLAFNDNINGTRNNTISDYDYISDYSNYYDYTSDNLSLDINGTVEEIDDTLVNITT